MSDDTHKILEDAFEKALTLNGADREAFLQSFAHDHPTFAPRLNALLVADDDSSDFLELPIAETAERLALEDEDPWLGQRVGAYTISSRIGAGGMGAVFLAERTDDAYQQQVAIKVMATQMLRKESIARFRSERQILASLSHPFIAKLIDGGSTDAGMPFLVMEYINGDPIDVYCRKNALGIEDRLRLFQHVCDAVDYAHRNLIVHRDLKPSNILIDENGTPKLLDFGIAKLLDPDDPSITMAQTGAGGRMMTPDYASPEQVRGEKISVATDVYALGVLLFRLLTFQSPYGASTTARDIENAILNDEPKSPSSVLTSTTRTNPTQEQTGNDADNAFALQRQLRRSIKGDLDNIVLKCLQKEPDRRYSSARDLSFDLGRYLSNKPVLAHGDSWNYRTRKFMIRRARPLAAAAASVATIIGLTAYYTVQLSKERNQAVIAARQAEREATKAQEVSGFLQSLFESASPVTAQGREITARELLEAGVEKIESLSDVPVVQAELLRIMGASYVDLGYSDLSVSLQERAVEILRTNRSVEPLDLAYGLHELAEAKRLHGELREAEAAMREALAIRERELGPNDVNVARTMGRLAVILFDIKELDEALALLRGAINIKHVSTRTIDEELLDMRGNLGITLDSLGRYDEAEPLMTENVQYSEVINGDLYPNTIIRLSNLGLVQLRRGRYQQGMATMQETLRRAEIVWPDGHPNLGVYKSVIGMTHLDLGNFEAARDFAEDALAITQDIVGENHFRYVARLRTLGAIMTQRAEFKEADAALARALSIADSINSEPNYQQRKIFLHTAQSLNLQGRYGEARHWLERAIRYPDIIGHSNSLHAKQELAIAQSHLGNHDEAETLLRKVIAAHEAAEGPENTLIIPVLTDLGGQLRRAGKLTEAETEVRRAIALSEKLLPTDHWHGALAKSELAYILHELRRRNEALASARSAYPIVKTTLSPDDPRLRQLENFLAG